MKNNPFKSPFPRRALLVGLGCVLILGWNLALAKRRKYYSGKLVPVVQKDLVLTVACPGRIEPKVQETLRSTINGKKKQLPVREGDRVKKGQLLIEIDDSEIKSTLNKKRNDFHNAMAEFNKAKKDHTLANELYKKLAVPFQDVENARQTFERAQQALQMAGEDLQKTEEEAKGTHLYSSLDGMVLKVFVENEDWIVKDKEVIKVAQMDNFQIRGKVDELDISKINLDQDSTIKCDAYPDKEFKGKVNWIGAQAADGAFPEVEVTVDILNAAGMNLKPNLSCEAEIVTGRMADAVVVPAEAIRKNAETAYVLKTSVLGWLNEQPVTVKTVSSGQAVIEKGLSPKELVLVPAQN